jgi:anti-sigma B factor antagonist
MSDSGRFQISSERRGKSQHLQLVGELDIATSPALERELDDAESSDAEIVVVDLSQLTFLDSSAIHVLLRASDAERSQLRVITGSPLVDRLFDLTRVRGRLTVIPGGPERSDRAPLGPDIAHVSVRADRADAACTGG